jgi:glycosyltransferase involved in cell wall biosynthesis
VRRRGDADVADLHFAGTGAYPSLLGALRRVPVVVHFQGPWADESALTGSGAWNVAVKRSIERRAYRRAERIVVLSAAFARVLVERYGVAPWSVLVIPPGVDLERFTPGEQASARAALGLGDARRVVLSVRRLVPRMGLEVLLQAWSRSEPAPGDVLVIVGDGPGRPELESLVVAHGVEASVRLCGRVDDDELVEWYRAADLTVVPSVALEGFGLVVLESAACGTPVLGSDVDGLREALGAVGADPPFAAGDVDALAAALHGAVAPSDAARATVRAAAASHGWEAVAERHQALYAEVLTRTGPRRVVVLDHTAVLSGGELALARALGGVGPAARVHAILATDGPFRSQLEAVGATVEVLTLDERVRSVRRASVRPGRVSVRTMARTAGYVLRLARRLRELRPDVVHTNSLKAALYGGAAARLAGVPCVWHLRDRIDEGQLPRPAVRAVRFAARLLPSVVVANSASTLATVVVSVGRVVPSPLDPRITARTRQATSHPLRVTVLGRLAPWKGQDLAITAFATALGGSDATLRIVGAALFGEDEYAASLPKLARRFGLGARVRFDGFVDDVAGVLANSDVVVHTSIVPEPFGQVVLEAMGAGCAVLVADEGGPASLVTDGVDGMHYEMGSVPALADALRRVADDAARRHRLGSAAAITAAAFTPEALAPKLLDAWDLAVQQRRPRRHRRKTVVR